MPIYFLLSWWTIPSLASRFDWFLYLQVTQTCKGEKEGGTRNIGNFRNKNKHNISPMIIPLPPVSVNFSTASESLNSSSCAYTHRLHRYHRNVVSSYPMPQPNPPLSTSDTIAAAVISPLWLENPFFFLSLKLVASLTSNTWEALQWVRFHQKAPEVACRPFKVLTLYCPKMFELIVLYVGVYSGN